VRAGPAYLLGIVVAGPRPQWLGGLGRAQERLVAELAGVASGPGGYPRRSKITPCPIPAEGIDGSLAEFISALQGGEPPMSECHGNIRSLAMVMAALESSRTGRRVRTEW
jgi:hypothetical protein